MRIKIKVPKSVDMELLVSAISISAQYALCGGAITKATQRGLFKFARNIRRAKIVRKGT